MKRSLGESGVYTYCLFCETAKCAYVASSAEKLFPCRAFSPKQVQHTWSKGKMVDIEHDLLPGYVFLYSAEEQLEARKLRSIQGVIKCLKDHDSHCELSGEDEQFALMLLKRDGVIGKTKVYQEGQMIRLVGGAFEGTETKILKVNRRNMRMQIEIPFASQKIKTWVEYELVEAIENNEKIDSIDN